MEIGCWLKGRKMTNFEKIRQLSEEEREIPYCQGNDRCSYLMDSGREIPESMCTECVKKWLQQVDVEKG